VRYFPEPPAAQLRCGCAAPPPPHISALAQAPACARGLRRLCPPRPLSLASSLAFSSSISPLFFRALHGFFSRPSVWTLLIARYQAFFCFYSAEDPPGDTISLGLRVLYVPFARKALFAAPRDMQHVSATQEYKKNASRRPVPCRFIYAPPSIPHILAAHCATYGSSGFPSFSPPNPPSSFFSLMSAPYVVLTRCAPSSH